MGTKKAFIFLTILESRPSEKPNHAEETRCQLAFSSLQVHFLRHIENHKNPQRKWHD